jgi:hypothetical protein
MRNQNIYTSALTRGMVAAAPANSKPLGTALGTYYGTNDLVQRAFVIYVKNPTGTMKAFRLTIESPPEHGSASFLEFGDLSSLDVAIAGYSTIARTVFVYSTNLDDTVTIRVSEIDWSGVEVPDGLTGEVVLNGDPTNPQIPADTDEIHNPNIVNPNIVNWAEVPSPNIVNPNIVNPNIVNPNIVNPNIVNPNIVNPNIVNPNIVNPNIVNPNIVNPNIVNPNIVNPNIVNPNIVNESLEDAAVYDVSCTVVNDGNTTTSYTLKTFSKDACPNDVYLQLLVFKVYYTAAADEDGGSGDAACLLKEERHHELLLNVVNPNIVNPNIVNPNIVNPNIVNESIENATFALAPGEEADVMVRIIQPNASQTLMVQTDMGTYEAFDIEKFAESIGFAATSQSVNTKEAREDGVFVPPATASKLIIGTSSLPDGVVGTYYSTTLTAYGGTEPYSWTLNSGELPAGLVLGSMGTISGTPTAAGLYYFIVRVDDGGGDFDTQRYSIYVDDDGVADSLTITTTSLPSGVLDCWYGATLEAIGGVWPRTWTLSSGKLPSGLSLDSDGVISGTIRAESGIYTFVVKVTDRMGTSDTQELSITVNLNTGTYVTISGTVYDESTGYPLDGVVMRGLPNTPVTDLYGFYQDSVPENWSGTVIPFKSGHSFDPESREYIHVSSNTSNQNYNDAGGIPAQIRVETAPDGTGAVVPAQNIPAGSSITVYAIARDPGGYFIENVAADSWSLVNIAGGVDDGDLSPSEDMKSALFTGNNPGSAQIRASKAGYTSVDSGVLTVTLEAWVARYNGPGNVDDESTAIAVDALGNVYVTGYSGGNDTSADYATIKYNNSGTEQWVARYNGPANDGDDAQAIAVDALGNVYVTGSSLGSGTGRDIATIKYNGSGVEQWVARYNSPGNGDDHGAAIAVDASGNVYVTGGRRGTEGSYYIVDIVTIKYDCLGEEQWIAQYNGPGNFVDHGNAIAIDSSGNVYVTGQSAGSETSGDCVTIKYDRSGEELWVSRYNGPGNSYDGAEAINIDSAGNVYVTGYSFGSGTDDDYVTIKYNNSGVEQWVARYNGPANGLDNAQSIGVDPLGNVYVTGYSLGSETNYDWATVKYDNQGVEQWVTRHNGPANYRDFGLAIAVNPLGHSYVTGISAGIGTFSDLATIKYGGSGDEQWAARYSGPENDYDGGRAIALDGLGNVFVTGNIDGAGGTPTTDFVSIKYVQSFPTALIISTEAMDVGYVGISYAKAIWAFGGSGSRTWFLGEEAILPPGLVLGSSTGIISGTPTSPGTYNFSVQVIDGLLVASRSLSITINTTVLPEGLVAYYPFNGNAHDVSGNGNHGIVDGATLTIDRFDSLNSAYNFDGVDDGIIIPNSTTLSVDNFQAGYTITAWVRLTTLPSSYEVIVEKGNFAFCLRTGGHHQYEACHNSNGVSGCLTTGFNVSPGVWSSIAVTWNAATGDWKMYLNGSPGSYTGKMYSLGATPEDGMIAIGRDSSQNRWYFNGIIDDVRIFNRALSASEIAALYDTEK